MLNVTVEQAHNALPPSQANCSLSSLIDFVLYICICASVVP